MQNFSTKFIETTFMGKKARTFSIPITNLLKIHYVAVRNRDDSPGAVQRVLNKRRISSIKEYILEGNIFCNTFIINWTNKDHSTTFKGNEINIPLIEESAQVIDGQHRLAGLREAITVEKSIGEQKILVTLFQNLSTEEAARIFININTEQRPVPKSLIYDLFGLIEDNPDHAINRATDIADFLNTEIDSPYKSLIKYPGQPINKGAIPLSTFVSTLKQHLGRNETFSNNKLRSLEHQKKVILNYFIAISSYYTKEGKWYNKSFNPFLKSSGFNGAIDFLTQTLISKCAEIGNFSTKQFQEFLKLDEVGLLKLEEIKSLDGKTARKNVKEYLESNLKRSLYRDSIYLTLPPLAG